jgi:PEGA domain-containing protein
MAASIHILMRALSASIAALAILLAASIATAGEIAIVVSGTATPHARAVASTAVSAGAADVPGNKVVASTFSAHDVANLTKCMTEGQPWVCMNPVLRGKGIQQLAVVSIDNQTGSDGSPMIVITEQIIAEDLVAPIGDKRYCDHCTDDVLGKLTSELTRDVLRELATRGGRTVVSIKSVPRGARITFDQKLVGATDTSLNTYPGTHSLSLELDGYQVVNRSVDAAEGKTADVNVALAKNPGAGDPSRGRGIVRSHDRLGRLPGYVPWLFIGAGGAAVVTGTVLVLVDSKPSTDPNSEHSKYYYSTKAPGIVTGIAGVLSTGAGLYILHRQHVARSTLTATPLPGGAAVQWTGAF